MSMSVSISLLYVNPLAFCVWHMGFPEEQHRLFKQEGNSKRAALQHEQWRN